MNGIQSLPRGAGRARLIRPELLDRPILNSSTSTAPSQTDGVLSNVQNGKPSTSSSSEVSSVHSNSSRESQILEMKTKKTGSKGEESFDLSLTWLFISNLFCGWKIMLILNLFFVQELPFR